MAAASCSSGVARRMPASNDTMHGMAATRAWYGNGGNNVKHRRGVNENQHQAKQTRGGAGEKISASGWRRRISGEAASKRNQAAAWRNVAIDNVA